MIHRKLPLSLIILSLLTITPGVQALERSGDIRSDETWSRADSPVLVTDMLTVRGGAVLTIEAGVEVRFASIAGLAVQGMLIAQGAEGDSIRFTSQTDHTPGAWGGIYFQGSWQDEEDLEEGEVAQHSLLDYCILEYAGSSSVGVGSAIEITAAGVTISHSSVVNCIGQSGTVRCGNLCRPVISDCFIASNHAERGGALTAGVGSRVLLTNNTFYNNVADDHGGAIYLSLSRVEIEHNSFLGNRAGGHGGAVYAAVSPELTLHNNVFNGNLSRSGSHNLHLTKKNTVIVKDNLFDSGDSTASVIWLNQADDDLDALNNYWGHPETFFFKDAIRDRNDAATEPYVYYDPFLWAPPANIPTNPTSVDSIILCRDTQFQERIPRGVAEGATLRVRLAGKDSDPFYRDLIRIRITSESDQEGIVMPLRETDVSSGIYVGIGRVEQYSDQENYTIGSREGGEVSLVAPYALDVLAVYPTLSPKPQAEEFAIDLTGAEDLQHLTNHTPTFRWGYFDVLEVPQKSFQFSVSNSAGSPMWDTGEIMCSDGFIAYTGQELLDGEFYTAKLKVKNDRFWSDEITLNFRMNSVPTAPEPFKPQLGELAVVLTPEIALGVSQDRENDTLLYRFEILDIEGSAVQLVRDIKAVDGEVLWTVPASLTENASYQFRALAYDFLEEGPWSEPRTFHINSMEEPAAGFDLIQPETGATLFQLHPTLSWNEAVDPDPLSNVTYRVEVDSTQSFTAPLSYPGLVELEFLLPDSLQNRTTYYWRVTAVDNTGLETASSSVGRFFVDTTPSIPLLSSPTAGEERQPGDMLSWQASTDPNPDDIITYEVEVWASVQMDSLIASSTGLGGQVSAPVIEVTVNQLQGWEELLDNHVYFWRVRSRDNHDAASQFTRIVAGSFFYNKFNDPPNPVPAFTAPADTVMGSNQVRFAWQEASDPDLSDAPATLVYELECSLTPFVGQVSVPAEVRKFESEQGTASLTAELDDNRLWHYRIRTRDNEDAVSGWSDIKTVLVNVAEDPPTAFELTSPTMDELVVELDSLLFQWQGSSDPDWESSIIYRLEVTRSGGQIFTTETPEVSYMFREGLTNEADYTWRVVAMDNTGLETVCNSAFAFKTSTTPTVPVIPAPPMELMPPDALSFEAASDPNPADALTYTIQIAPEAGFATPLVNVDKFPHNAGVIGAVIQNLTGQEKLEDDVDYYFRVRATDNHGYSSAFSDPAPFRFNRENDAPGAPAAPFAPPLDEVMRTTQPTLSWGAAYDVDLSDPADKLVYDIRLDMDGEVAKSAAVEYSTPAGATEFQIPAPVKDNTPWVWQVRTRDDDGAMSEWSATMNFLVNVQEDPPTPPELVTPRANETMNHLGPIDFTWGPSTDIDYMSSVTYTLEYDTSAEFSSSTKSPGLELTTLTVEGPLENAPHYWRVIATDNTGLETPSPTGRFTLDTRPTVPFPKVPAELFELTPDDELTWTLSVDPNPDDKITYEFQIGVEFSPEKIEVRKQAGVEANAVSMKMGDLLGDNQTFNWRVRAVDNHGISSEWSTPAKFVYNAVNDPPTAVKGLTKPTPGTEVTAVNLAWEPAADPDFSDTPELLNYRVEIGDNADFSGEVVNINTPKNTTGASTGNLKDDARYYWRVRAIDDEGEEGPVSEVWTFIFNTRNDPPGEIPSLLEPVDGADVATARIAWTAAADQDITDTPDRLHYRVELSPDANFAAGVVTLDSDPGQTRIQLPSMSQARSPALPELEEDTRYYWRVRAVDDEGAQGPVSLVRNFFYNTGNTAPKAFNLTAPMKGGSVPAGAVTLIWSASSDSDPGDQFTYTVMAATDAAFTMGVRSFDGLTETRFELPVDVAAPGATVYWKVKAVDSGGLETWGSGSNAAPWSFTIPQ